MKTAIITSGGDAPGMNAAVRAVTRYIIANGGEVFGFRRGYQGIIDNDYTALDRVSVADIMQLGGTFLGTDRCDDFNKLEFRKLAAENLGRLGVDWLVVVGGDGSFRGAADLARDTDIKVVGVPGTIDNDLAYTDYTIGFDTAVSNAVYSIGCIKDTMVSHGKVSFVEVMGRHCGDIALYAGITCGAEYILVPEEPYDLEKIAETVKRDREGGKKPHLIVMAEGIGKVEDVAAEFKKLSGITPRVDRLGFVQRGGNPTARDRLIATRLGLAAAKLVLDGKSGRVVGIRNDAVVDMDIYDALGVKRRFNKELYETSAFLS